MAEKIDTINVAIISDGKAGHLHQSQGVAFRIPGAEVQTFNITYGKDNVYYSMVLAARTNVLLPKDLVVSSVQRGLGDRNLNALLEFKPRVIISTGALTAPMNLMCGRLTGALKVVCMRPNLLPVKAFDLIVVPAHDSPGSAPNILSTVGATNIVDPEKVEEQAREFARRKGIDPARKTIGILLGGDSRIYIMLPEPIRGLLESVSEICVRLGAQWLITTSRRTPEEVDALVEAWAAGDPNCVYRLIAHKDPFNPVSEIIGLSNVVIVTQDSVSMVSETASAGRRAVIVPVDKRRPGQVKYERMFKRLEQLDYAKLVEIEGLVEVIDRELGRKGNPEPLNDAQKAADAVVALLKMSIGSAG